MEGIRFNDITSRLYMDDTMENELIELENNYCITTNFSYGDHEFEGQKMLFQLTVVLTCHRESGNISERLLLKMKLLN